MDELNKEKLLSLIDKVSLYNSKVFILLPYNIRQDIIDLCKEIGVDYHTLPKDILIDNDKIYIMPKEVVW